MSHVAILMYHRICKKTKDTQCYFARGTAVDPEIFEQQLEFLAKEYTFVSLSKAVDIMKSNQKGKYCVLTFDDGYIEIKDVVWPLCKKRQIPICIFPIAGHTAEAQYPVYVDFYYAVIHYAKIRTSVDLKFADIDIQAPGIEEDLQWWIRGPLKEKLHIASVEEQIDLLQKLSAVLDSELPPNLPKKLYLSKKDLHNLYKEGIEIGGHGYHHRQLSKASDKDLQFEITESVKLLSEIGVSNPRLFCYPDGSYSKKVIELLHLHGFKIACTVVQNICNSGSSPIELSRILMCNSLPLQNRWPKLL